MQRALSPGLVRCFNMPALNQQQDGAELISVLPSRFPSMQTKSVWEYIIGLTFKRKYMFVQGTPKAGSELLLANFSNAANSF